MQYTYLLSALSAETLKKAQKKKSQYNQIGRPSGKHK